ncbi:MAG: UDP-N-acetylmuramoyl-L-alanyl-D-glutamate--2,6-diaminopimelate ligase [Myxococcota bacterium]
MRLSDLLSVLQPNRVDGPTDRDVAGVTHDSREAGVRDVFVAIRGARVDGRTFAPDLDVVAVIADGPVTVKPGVTRVLVADARRALAVVAAILHGSPGRRVPVVAVTGTNGKTTTCWMVEHIALAAGRTPGVLGTNGHRLGGQPLPDGPLTRFTTPESPILQALLSQMIDGGSDLVAMEASSIGLHARRADQIPFRAAGFTSFSRDHLNYHGTEAAYLEAKQRLFTELIASDGVAVLNADDPAIIDTPTRAARCWRYSRHRRDVELYATDSQFSLQGTSAQVVTPAGSGRLTLPLIGAYNLENALAALGLSLAVGIALEDALAGLASLPAIAGRLERVQGAGEAAVFVDYAHTPDALVQVLAALRPLTPGRVLTVFGCGGDRDPGKRPMMGQAASSGSDQVYVTSDNPRSEDPDAIIAQIMTGVVGAAVVEADRAAAIGAAVRDARPGDVVLIAGKGHETYQIIGSVKRPFSDVAMAEAALQRKEAG